MEKLTRERMQTQVCHVSKNVAESFMKKKIRLGFDPNSPSVTWS